MKSLQIQILEAYKKRWSLKEVKEVLNKNNHSPDVKLLLKNMLEKEKEN